MSYIDDVLNGKYGTKKKKKQMTSNSTKKTSSSGSSFIDDVLNGDYTGEFYSKNKEIEDIAPVKEEKPWYKQILQTPEAFKDGYQFGDVTKTIGGTIADIGMGAAKGAAGLGEGIGTLAAGGVAQIADWVGKDEYADKVRKKIANKDEAPLISNFLKKGQNAVDDYSISGDTGDVLSEGAGYLGGLGALGRAAGTVGGLIGKGAKATDIARTVAMFGSSAGNTLSESYQKEGVEDWQVWAKAIGSGYLTAKIEKWGGVFGTGSLDTKVANAISSKIMNGAGKLATRIGVSGTTEMIEEFAEYVGNQGLDFVIDKVNSTTSKNDATFLKEWDWDEVGQNMFAGFVLGSGAKGLQVAGDVANNMETNKMGLKEAINETARVEDTRGQLEVLTDKKASLEEDLGIKNLSQTEIDKTFTEMQQIDNQIKSLETAPRQEVVEQSNAQTITNESELRKQHFTYQAQETDSDIKKAVYESASQVMNNTENSHKFVDVVAKIAEERGTTYKFTNNEQLKQMGYAKDNVTVNGLVNENGEVLINIDSAKYLNRVVGHETTHLLEGTKEYEALKQVAIEYAKSKGDYDTKMAQLYSLYKDTNANIENELVSDIVGDYLFTDETFIKNLSVKQPTVFEKIKNFISDLVVKFKGTEQEKQLRQLQRSFEKAYKTQGTQTNTDTKYSFIGSEITSNNTQAQESLNAAKSMLEDDMDMDFIRQNTGWFKATDGNWKAEVDDSNAKFVKKLEKNHTYKLGEILKHNDLYSFVPEYQNITVKTVDLPSDTAGRRNKQTGEIQLNNKYLNNSKELKATILHELQHATQKKEGFAGGISFKKAGSTDAYLNNKGEIEAREVEKRMDMSFDERMRKAPSTQSKIQYSLSEDGKMVDNKGNEVKLEASETGTHGTLMAIHNLTEQKFEGLMELKGIPSPSIAVTKSNLTGDLKYGEISVLFDKSTIDPTNKKNEVYNSDIYSTRFPNLGNIINESKFDSFVDNLENLGVNYGNALEIKERIADNDIDSAKNYLKRYLERANSDITQEEINELYQQALDSIQEKRIIRDDVDIFTPSGNRRTLKQRSLDYTLDNLVKIMTKKSTKGSESSYVTSGTIRGNMAQKFKTISDIKSQENNLVSSEEIQKIKDQVNDKLDSISSTLSKYHTTGSNWQSIDAALYSINETAKSKKINTDILKANLVEDQFNVDKIPNELLQETIDFLNDLKTIPSEYFEAKPQRAVGFDEIKAVVIPNNASESFKQKLVDNDLNVIEYDPNIKGDRQAKINELDDLKFSLSQQGEEIAPTGNWNVRGEDVKLQVEEVVAPVQKAVEKLTKKIDKLQNKIADINNAPVNKNVVEKQNEEAFKNITDNDIPTVQDNTIPDETDTTTVNSPFENRDIDKVGNKSVKAYQYENPEVRPYFQEEAQNMLYDLDNTVKGQKGMTQDELGNTEFYGTTRQTTEAIAYLKDNYGYSYAQIRKGLNDIIEDNGKENNAVAKRIEFMLDERLRDGYITSDGIPIPANQEYINFLNENQITEYNRESSNTLTDKDAPIEIAPEPQKQAVEQPKTEVKEIAPLTEKVAQNGNTEQTELNEIKNKVENNPNLSETELIELMDKVTELEKKRNRIQDPLQISKLTEKDADTTPELPIKKIKKGDKESSFYKNVTETSQMLSEETRQELAKDENIKFYAGVTNKQSLTEAYKRLEKGGTAETLRWIKEDFKDATDVAEGWILLKQYQDKGDIQGAVEVAKKMRNGGTKAGQMVQAYNIMQRLTPEGMFMYAQKELSEAFEIMSKHKTKKWIDANKSKFELTPQDTALIKNNMQEVQTMPDGYEKRVKLAEIQKMIQDKIPPESGQGIKAWMRISMLGNPKTLLTRNPLGNLGVVPVNAVADMIASQVDKVIAKKTNVRTTGNLDLKQYTKGFKKGMYESYSDFKKGINTRNMDGNRFEVNEGKNFNDNKLIGKALNKVDNAVSFALDVGDRGFYEGALLNSINNQMILNNTDTVTQEMIDIATTEALTRTWQDNNSYTEFVLKTREMLNKVGVKGYGLGDVLIPFAKTPANLTKAIVEYSPVGFVNTLIDGKNLKNAIETGQFDAKMQHKFVQNLGKATAGTMLYVLGYALAQAGITGGESEEDKDAKNFLKNTLGINAYSIKIGDHTFTYDWMQPIAAPLSIMANVVKKQEEEATLQQAILSSLDTAGNLLVQQSFMESINTVISNKDGIATGLMEALLELPSRAIPTLSKQITDMVDGTQRQSFVYDDPLKTMGNKIINKIPFLSDELAPSVDTLGRDIQKYGGENNWFNVFLNPANLNASNTSESGEEIYRLYKETGDKTIMPRQVPYYINSDGKKINLSNEERTQFQTTAGTMADRNITALLNDETYKSLSDENKAKVVSDIVNYSYNVAQSQVMGTELSEQYQSAKGFTDLGGKISDYYLFKNGIDDTDADTKKATVVDGILNMSATDQQKAYLYGKYYSSEDALNLVLDTGISVDEFVKFNSQEFVSDKNSEGNSISGSRKKKVYDYINSMNIGYEQKLILAKMEYNSEDRYNYEIIEYLNNDDSISFNTMRNILIGLGFNVDEDGNINW